MEQKKSGKMSQKTLLQFQIQNAVLSRKRHLDKSRAAAHMLARCSKAMASQFEDIASGLCCTGDRERTSYLKGKFDSFFEVIWQEALEANECSKKIQKLRRQQEQASDIEDIEYSRDAAGNLIANGEVIDPATPGITIEKVN